MTITFLLLDTRMWQNMQFWGRDLVLAWLTNEEGTAAGAALSHGSRSVRLLAHNWATQKTEGNANTKLNFIPHPLYSVWGGTTHIQGRPFFLRFQNCLLGYYNLVRLTMKISHHQFTPCRHPGTSLLTLNDITPRIT